MENVQAFPFNVNCTGPYTEVRYFRALCDTKFVRSVLKQTLEAGEGQFASLHRQEGHQGSRVGSDKHQTHNIGREVNYSTRPRSWD